MSPLLQQVQQAIDAVAAEKGLDIVLNTTTSTGDVIILYVAESLRGDVDITDAVMARLEI
jgi:outer membrane protein